MHAAFKTVSNAIELAKIASSTALMQACKRGASSARVVGSNECSTEVQKGILCEQCKDLLIHVLVSCLFYGASFCFVETILALRLTFAFFAGAFI